MLHKEEHRLLAMEVLERVAPMIRAAAHPLRLRILDFLDHEGEPCSVGHIVDACGTSQAFVSQQLRILKDQGILSCRRQGNSVLYEIANRAILHLVECIRSHEGECAAPDARADSPS